MCPGEIGGELYRAGIIVAVGGTDTHGFDGFDTAHLVDDDLQGFHAGVNVVFHFVVTLSLDGCGSLDVTSGVNDSEHGVGTSKVQTNHIGLNCWLCIHNSINIFSC